MPKLERSTADMIESPPRRRDDDPPLPPEWQVLALERERAPRDDDHVGQGVGAEGGQMQRSCQYRWRPGRVGHAQQAVEESLRVGSASALHTRRRPAW